jgi:hypothetical protein
MSEINMPVKNSYLNSGKRKKGEAEGLYCFHRDSGRRRSADF